MNKNKKLGFTLAEVLIVIGIIGVVAALTLPNLNHATGDKETVTRLQKAYSILSEANDRAVAIYGPISTWASNEQCADNFSACWMKRIGEFLKISKSCDETGDEDSGSYVSCDSIPSAFYAGDGVVYLLPDNISFATNADGDLNCNTEMGGSDWFLVNDICISQIDVDVNGPNKGKNEWGTDTFAFMLSDSLGIIPYGEWGSLEDAVSWCVSCDTPWECGWWILDYGNLDFLKADSSGKCNDSNIILDGVTNTSCH